MIKRRFSRIGLSIAALALLLLAAAVGWFFMSSTQISDSEDLQKTINRVSKLAILPAGEEPSLATVKDKSKLQDEFLRASGAENGDRLLIYPKAQKVYVYRPAMNKIVDIGPLVIKASAEEVKDTRVIVRNGTGNQDLTKEVTDKIRSNYPALKSVSVEPASRGNFANTIVIDLTDDKKFNLMNDLARTINGARGVVPIGESKPENAEILIIIGQDQL